MSDELKLVLIYVPEAEVMDFDDALVLALERDERSAEQLRISAE